MIKGKISQKMAKCFWERMSMASVEGKSSKDFECVHGVWRRGGDPLNRSLLDFQKDSVVLHQTLLKKSNCPEMGRKALSWVKGQEGKGWGLIVNFQIGEELAPGFPLGFMLGQVLICIFVSGVKKSWNSKIANPMDDELLFYCCFGVFFWVVKCCSDVGTAGGAS